MSESRLIMPKKGDLTPEVARKLLEIDFSAEEHRRVELLSAKAQEGTLTNAELAELDDSIRASAERAVIQSKARQFLKQV